MKAVLSLASGGPETLVVQEIADPLPQEGEVVVDVMACGVNYPDALVIEDRYQYRPERPFSPGVEIAGVVSAIGPGVSGIACGDRVFACPGWGGMAEKVVLPANRCYALPDDVAFETGAALLMAYGTSLHALRDRGRIVAGETVLVLGAAGGVGLAAVEIAAACGCRVIAAVSTAEKARRARAHGASETLVYPPAGFDAAGAKAFSARIRALTDGAGVDVVYDAVGGTYSEPALRATAWDGRYLIVGFPAGIPRIPLNLPLLKGCSVVGVFWGEFVNRDPESYRESVAELLRLLAVGGIRPVISRQLPLDRSGEAIAILSARQAIGKIVVAPHMVSGDV